MNITGTPCKRISCITVPPLSLAICIKYSRMSKIWIAVGTEMSVVCFYTLRPMKTLLPITTT